MKDAYYFPHDCNAMDDPKIMLLVSQLGIEGYGIYWVIIEHLRNQPDFITSLNVIPGLSMRCGTTREKIQTVINQFGLFCITEDNTFYSPSLITRMEPYLARKEAGRIGGIASGLARTKQLNDGSTMVQRSLNKESKGKESKVNKIKEEKIKGVYADNVDLTSKEYNTLVAKWGVPQTKKLIETLDNYKGSSGKKYLSDYRAILSWVIDKVNPKIYQYEKGGVSEVVHIPVDYEAYKKRMGIVKDKIGK